MARYFVVTEKYRSLLELLTPRQLKGFLRARLIDPREGDPAEKLLESIFPPFYQMYRQEIHLFNMLHDTALALHQHALRNGMHDPNALALFEHEIRRVATISRFLEPGEVERYWPRKMREKKVLLQLLSSLEAAKTTVPEEMTGIDKTFSAWVSSELGQDPKGATIAEQVSSFQDMVLEQKYYQNQQGEAQRLVRQYMMHYWAQHENQFNRGSAETLSNLATMMQGDSKLAVETDTLYRKALNLSPNHHRIPLLYMEYLMDLLLSGKADSLFEDGYYPDKQALYEWVEQLCERNQEAMDGEALLRIDGIKLGLETLQQYPNLEDRTQISVLDWMREKALSLLVAKHVPLFIQAAKTADMGPATRLDNILSDIMGKAGITITYKGQVLIVLSQLLNLCGLNSWTVDVHIEDDYVGEDSSTGRWYKIGLQVSRYLLAEPELLQSNPSHVAMIWTQSAQAITHGKQTQTRERVALAFLAAQAYGGLTANWQQRLNTTWQEVSEEGDTTDTEQLESVLTSEQRQLIHNLKEDSLNTELITSIIEHVFGDSFELLDLSQKNKIHALGKVDGNTEDGWGDEVIEQLSNQAQELSEKYCTGQTA
jgi:regulator of RNase E activity RraB